MFQITKKDKSLSRKHNAKNNSNKDKLNIIISKEDSSSIFGTDYNSSLKNDSKEDSSLLSVDTPLKYRSCPNGHGCDEIKYSNESETCVDEENTSVEVYLENKIESTAPKSIFDEETIIGDINVFNFPNEANNVLDDSSFVFKSDSGNEGNAPEPDIKTTRLKEFRPITPIDNNALSDDDVSISCMSKNESNLVVTKPAVDTTNESDDKPQNQCPICFKTTTKYINHMKSCAAKNNLTTQQLLSVLNLHKRQLAERKELGLGPPAPSFRAKISPKRNRTVDKKVPIDSNLQLALALSASLQSAEEIEVIQEAEALKEAGLSEEADRKLSTLEKFGFASDLPVVSHNVKGNSKACSLIPTLLMKRTKEDRERIITEKVAIVLISEEESIVLDSFIERRHKVKSRKLSRLWTEGCPLWNKAHCPSEEQRDAFYLHTLSKFIEPSTSEVGEGLKRLSQVPGRLNTPVTIKDNISDVHLTPRLQAFSGTKKGLSSASTVQRYSVTPDKTNTLSEDWRKLVGNSCLSDVLIQCNQGEIIPAHKLVLHVRCPTLLQDSRKHDSGKEIIVLDDYTKESVLIFLEFVYSGSLEKMLYLSSQEFQSIISLSEKYNYDDLKNKLSFMDQTKRHEGRKLRGKNLSKQLFVDFSDAQDEKDYNLKTNNVESDVSTEYDSPHSNLENVMEVHSQKSDEYSTPNKIRGSPDMFGDSSIFDKKPSSPERDDLAMLASLVGKSCFDAVDIDSSSNISSKFEDIDSTNTLSLSGCASVKRKAVNSSLSEDEDITKCKKICTDVLQPAIFEDLNKDKETLDLTQSSDSSKGDSPVENQQEFGNESDDCKIVSPTEHFDECLEELTQQNPSVTNSPSVEKLSPTRDVENAFNIDCPAWDGFEDGAWYYNNYEVNTPIKNSTSQKCSGSSITKSEDRSQRQSSPIKYISSASKSPNKNSLHTSSPSSSVSSFKNSPHTKDTFSELRSKKAMDMSISNYKDGTEKACFSKDNSKQIKTSKNLSFQFDTGNDFQICEEKSSSDIESRKKLSAFETISISPDIKENKCSKRDSLAEMQRLLDDSFEINESKLECIEALSNKPVETNKEKVTETCASTSPPTNVHQEHVGNLATTPTPEIYVSDNVTPLPSYSSMKTPALKKELRRFGLKPSLGKGKAKLLLRHIYEQTHPFVAEPVGVKDAFKQPEGQPLRSPVKSRQNTHSTVDLVDSESEESCSQKSTSSSISSSATLPEESFFESEEELTQAPNLDVGDIRTSIRNLIVNDADLHRKILMYEPIFVEDLKAMLKERGIKSKADQIIEFLDEQCITFRTTSWKKRNEKRKQKQKSPKKKARVKNSGELSKSINLSPKKHVSPSKIKPSKAKKIGRPRKNSKEL